MIGRFVLLLLGVGLLVSLLVAFGLPRPVSAQDPLPTPAGQLGGRMPLPTAEGLLGVPQPQQTPPPPGHPLAGAWLLTFAEPDQPPVQAVLGNDGVVTFIDSAGNRGAGVWMPNGQHSGVVVVAVRAADEMGQLPQLTILRGSIDVGTPADTATLVYSVETVDESGATSGRAGPFTGRGQRVGAQMVVPTRE